MNDSNSEQAIIMECCPLCQSSTADTHAAFQEFTWVRCDCGVIYKRSAVPESEDEEIYDPEYFKAGDSKHAHSYDKRTQRRINKSRRQILDALNHTDRGPVLDIGCSLGYTLDAAKRLGLDCAGIDIAPFAIDACRANGFRAEIGGLDSMPFEENSFAVVTMKHVLEHTPDPRTALREAHRVLRPGGALFVAIPHASYRKATRDPLASRFFRPDCPGGTEHFVYYTPTTLTRLMEDEGFSVRRVHPHLLHRKASLGQQLIELLVAPFRFLGGTLATTLRLRKEFWLVAVAR